MSGRATGWVLQHGPRPTDVDAEGQPYGTARARGLRAVLLTVADAANADGEHAHPGLAAVMEGSLYARRQALRLLADLEAEGWLEVTEAGGGRGVATVYSVCMDRRRNGATTTPPDARNGAMPATETVPSDAETVPNGGAAPYLSNGLPNGTTQRARKALLPEPFLLTAEMRTWAAEHTPTVDAREETAKFCDHWRSKAERRADWVATWRNWMRNAVRYSGGRSGNGRRPDPADVRRDLPAGVVTDL